MDRDDWVLTFVDQLRTWLPRWTEQAARDLALRCYDEDKEPRAAAHHYYLYRQVPTPLSKPGAQSLAHRELSNSTAQDH